jgi:hypothetical protein
MCQQLLGREKKKNAQAAWDYYTMKKEKERSGENKKAWK